MITYKEFLQECEEYIKLVEVYKINNLDYITEMYLKENDVEYSNRRKLEYPYVSLATMSTW